MRRWRPDLCIALVFVVIGALSVEAHELEIHNRLTQRAIDFLLNKERFGKRFSFLSEHPEYRGALADGSVAEDDATFAGPRYVFHFLPALTAVSATCNAMQWGFGGVECTPRLLGERLNREDWQDAVGSIGSSLNEAFGRLGHVAHLLQDMASPPHTRNDAHAHKDILGVVLGDPDDFETDPRVQSRCDERDGVRDCMPVSSEALIEVAMGDERTFLTRLRNRTAEEFYSNGSVRPESEIFEASRACGSETSGFGWEGFDWRTCGPPADRTRSDADDEYYRDGAGRRLATKGWLWPSTDEHIAREEFDVLAPRAVLYTASLIAHFVDKVDADGDGLPDVREVLHWGSITAVNDANGDADGDGLTNIDEIRRSTDPTKTDTDGDGFTDKQEVDAGTDPLDPASKPAPTLPIYDDFSGVDIDGGKWRLLERIHEIDGGTLYQRLRVPEGLTGDLLMRVVSAPAVSSIQADMKLLEHAPGGSSVSTRIVVALFNDGSAPGGGFAGDVFAELHLGGSGATPSASYSLGRCNDANCNSFTLFTGGMISAAVALDHLYRIRVTWDGAVARFGFTDAQLGLPETVQVVNPFAFTGRAGPPTSGYAGVGARKFTRVGGIISGAGAGSVAASIDNVLVNGLLYDTFDVPNISEARWRDLEFVREIQGGKLAMRQRATSAIGSRQNNSLGFPTDLAVSAMSADVAVTSVVNAGVARLFGTWYNDGAGDITAQIQVGDEGTGLRKGFGIGRCTSVACTAVTVLHTVDLGPAVFGQTYRIYLEWTGEVFRYGIDGDIRIVDPRSFAPVARPAPTLLSRIIGTRLFGLTTIPREIRATFDNIGVNADIANQAPVVSGMSATPMTVLVGGNALVSVAASDPEGDPLSYTWSASGGALSSASGPGPVTWTAPGIPGTYTVTVRVTDGRIGRTPVTRSINLVVTSTAPTAFSLSGSAACSGTLSRVILSWTVSMGATGYQVFRDGALYAGTGTTLTFTDTAVTPGVPYTYRVRALNAAGSTDSNAVTITPTVCGPVLTVGPTSLNFGGVPIGACVTANFAVQHVVGTAPATGTVSASPNPPFGIVSGSSFSLSGGGSQLVDVRFCPRVVGPASGSAIVSSSATFTGTNTVALIGAGTSLLTNGGFESGTTGWVFSGAFQADSRFANSRSGTGYAYLARSDGSGGDNLIGSMYQAVAIPSAAISPTLTFWYNITSWETSSTPFDVLNVRILNSGGTYLATVAVLSNLHKAALRVYSSVTFDLTPFKGQTIRIHFLGTTDGILPTVFRIDDVGITVR